LALDLEVRYAASAQPFPVLPQAQSVSPSRRHDWRAPLPREPADIARHREVRDYLQRLSPADREAEIKSAIASGDRDEFLSAAANDPVGTLVSPAIKQALIENWQRKNFATEFARFEVAEEVASAVAYNKGRAGHALGVPIFDPLAQKANAPEPVG